MIYPNSISSSYKNLQSKKISFWKLYFYFFEENVFRKRFILIIDNFNNYYRIFFQDPLFWLHGPDYDSSTPPTIIIMTRNHGTDEKTKNARWEGSRRGYWDCFYQTRNSTKTPGLLSDLKITWVKMIWLMGKTHVYFR